MSRAVKKLQKLQKQISDGNAPTRDDYYTERLYFAEVHGLLHVEFYGEASGESFFELCELLCDGDVAYSLKSLTFRGQDGGTNGTRTWDFSSVIEREVIFSNLTSLYVEPTLVEHHNRTLMEAMDTFEEQGMIGRLLAKMPKLEILTVPSAPDATFFNVGERPLVVLQVDAGYNHENFILNLSQSLNFPLLRHLDFGDYSQTYMDNFIESYTPFSHYKQLFLSSHFKNLRGITIRNSLLTTEQLQTLRDIRKDLQVYVIQSSGNYIYSRCLHKR
jgi:hypothetical protein